MTTFTISCPTCNFDNLCGALVCAQCSVLLVKLEGDTYNSTLTPPLPNPETVAPPIRLSTLDQPALTANSLALYIGGRITPLIVDATRPVLLGRPRKDGGQQPHIDLTLYGGYERGISRRHAIIRSSDSGFVVEDLGSANGSSLNGKNLLPYTATSLKPNDRLKLGKLEILLYFRD
jgi:hypothetical protein